MRMMILLFAAILAQAQVPSPEGVAAGKKLFAAYCSVGYCHGSEGKAGRGPRLRDREWDREYLFKVIDGGIPNSSMPAWRSKLSNAEMHAIVAYILSISKEIVQTGAQPEVPKSGPAIAGESLTQGEGIMGSSAGGRNLFFDAANDRNCGVCHKAGGAGGDSGPDLSKLTSLTPREIFKLILLPPAGKTIEIVMKDGEHLGGIMAQENASGVRVYDLSSPGPPVLRSLNLADIASRHTSDRGVVHDMTLTCTMRQLLDLVTFLKSPETAAVVRLDDLF